MCIYVYSRMPQSGGGKVGVKIYGEKKRRCNDSQSYPRERDGAFNITFRYRAKASDLWGW